MDVMADPPEPLEEKPARRAARELMNDEFLDQLMARVDEGDLALTGEGGFLPELVKAVLERGLDARLTSHLGYEEVTRQLRHSRTHETGRRPRRC